MSVTDPLIKDIKGCTLKLLQEAKVLDSSPHLLDFCFVLEKIFYNGLVETAYFNRKTDAFTWMAAASPHGNLTFQGCVERTLACQNVSSKMGRFRLLVRCCLVRRCLHVPLQDLVEGDKVHNFYLERSIVGDEILAQILLSVLMQIGKINFDLALANSAFLDHSWALPEVVRLELVPCKTLGVSISYAGEKAVIVTLKPNSVASENGNINVGDVIDNLNGMTISSATKGRLNSILHMGRGQPVNITVIKCFDRKNGDIYPPIRKLLKDLQIDVDDVKNKYFNTSPEYDSKIYTKLSKSAGFTATYLGHVDVGNKGNVKQIDKAIKLLLATNSNKDNDKESACKMVKSVVSVEIGELGVRVLDFATNELIMRHSYMQISSCGSGAFLPSYFAYIAGEENCDLADNFTCYIFHSKNSDEVCTILQSMGQGFQRTHFAV